MVDYLSRWLHIFTFSQSSLSHSDSFAFIFCSISSRSIALQHVYSFFLVVRIITSCIFKQEGKCLLNLLIKTMLFNIIKYLKRKTTHLLKVIQRMLMQDFLVTKRYDRVIVWCQLDEIWKVHVWNMKRTKFVLLQKSVALSIFSF